MYTKKNLMRTASVCSFICSFGWFFAAAWNISLGNSGYWLCFVLGFASLYLGLMVESIRERMTQLALTEADQKKYLVCWLVSIIAPPAFVLNTIAYFRKREDSYTITPVDVVRQDKKKMPAGKKKTAVLAAALCVVLVASFVAMLFETSFMRVKVSSFTLTKEMTERYNSEELNGQSFVIVNEGHQYGVNLYVPKTASAENPAPVVFVLPGFTRTKETMSQYCIELSRRGAVVFCLDPGAQGSTTYAGHVTGEDGEPEQISATTEANGMNYLVQYVYSNTDDFDYIDRGRFGLIGHSAGGGDITKTAQALAGESFEESIVKAIYVSGYIKNSAANRFKDFNCNAAMSYAYFDEGVFRYQSDTSSFNLVAQRFINEVRGQNNQYDEVILDYGYGDMSAGTYRIVHQEHTNHCFEMYDSLSISNSVNFFSTALEMDSGLEPTQQIWWGKEICNGIALAGGFTFVIALSALLVDTKFFSGIKGQAVEGSVYDGRKPGQRRPKRTADKVIFWSAMVITAIIACLDYIPLASLSISLFPDAASNTYTFFFPARMINAVMLWAAVNGTIGLVLFFAARGVKNLIEKQRAAREGRAPDYTPEHLTPIKIGPAALGKTVLLAVILFGAFFLLIQLCSMLFHQDFRFMLISAGTLKPRFVVTWLMYVPIFFLFYISNSIRVNCSIGFEGWKEWKVMLVSGLANSIGLVFILVVNYVSFFVNGEVFYGYYGAQNNEVWLYINIVFGLIPMMFILPIFNRLFYRQTNRVWLGAITTCLIFIMMTLSASVSYIPM